MAMLVYDHIIRLKVSENYVLLVKSLYAKKNLLYVEPRFVFAKATLDLEILAEITSWAIVRNEEQMLTSLECIS